MMPAICAAAAALIALASATEVQDRAAPTTELIQIGAEGDDRGYGLAVAADGSFVIGGKFGRAVDFARKSPPRILKNGANYDGGDGFVAAYDADGRCRWAVDIGGGGMDWCLSVALDPEGNVFAAGQFEGTVDFDPGPGSVVREGDGCTGYVLSLDRNGGFRWVQTIPTDDATLVADQQGNVFLVASNITNKPIRRTFLSVRVAKYANDGKLVWSKTLDTAIRASAAAAPGGGCAVAAQGRTGGNPQGQETRILHFDCDGAVKLEFAIQGRCHVTRGGLAVDSNGTSYLAAVAWRNKIDVDPGPGVYEIEPRKSFVTRYDRRGRLLNAFDVGEVMPRIAVAGLGDVLVGGTCRTLSRIPGAARVRGIEISRYSAAGKLVWQHRADVDAPAGTQNDPHVHRLHFDTAGRVHALGRFGDTLKLPGKKPVDSAGSHDVLLLRFDGTRGK